MMSTYSNALLRVSIALLYFQSSWAFTVPRNFVVDIHCHSIPDIYRQALIDAGYPYINGTLLVDGSPVPTWDVDLFVQNRVKYGYNYSIMSITAPGVNFLASQGSAQVRLARRLNDQMAVYLRKYPTQLGAYCILPMPNIAASLAEIKYCLDTLKFDGVGLYSNYNGIYLGDPSLNAVMAELNKRKVGVLVHPASPVVMPNLAGIIPSELEYPFDTTRAVANLLNQGTVLKYPDVSLIFVHGGGTIPYLASRIAGFQTGVGGKGTPVDVSLAEMKGLNYDLAVVGSEPQFAALDAFLDKSQILLGTDYPFAPDAVIAANVAAIFNYKGFSQSELRNIKYGNAMELFPRILQKLSHPPKKPY